MACLGWRGAIGSQAMGALLALFVIAAISLVVVRLGAAALTMTGMSADAANFQANSAFFGVGFTTREAEMVMSHRVRRRIVRDLIIAGNIGLTSALATLVATFIHDNGTSATLRTVGLLVLGAVVFWLLARSKVINHALEWSIRFTLKRSSAVRSMDYEPLLKVESGYIVVEFEVLDDSPLAGRTIAESHPTDIGIVILGISKEGKFIGVPGPKDRIDVGNAVTVYGHEDAIGKIRGRVDVVMEIDGVPEDFVDSDGLGKPGADAELNGEDANRS